MLDTSAISKSNRAKYLGPNHRTATPEEQREIVERLLLKGEIMEERKRMLAAVYEESQREELSFRPQTRSKSPIRTFGEFLKAQYEFQKQKEENLKQVLFI